MCLRSAPLGLGGCELLLERNDRGIHGIDRPGGADLAFQPQRALRRLRQGSIRYIKCGAPPVRRLDRLEPQHCRDNLQHRFHSSNAQKWHR